MGGYLSYQKDASNDALPVLGKRKHDEDIDDEMERSLQYTPRKKKMRTTADYIYQVLFVGGENSDITVRAFGHEWQLHKLYLKQCGYFGSMFSGSWKESDAAEINLDIPDENIDTDALGLAFGCLYKDELSIEPVRVIPVLAAASLLQMDDLMHQCGAIMEDSITSKNVCSYYEASKMYGLSHIGEACLAWLVNNTMCKQNSSLLKQIGPEIMIELIKSPDLFVMQVEMDVYNLLKRWLFLQILPSWSGSYKSCLSRKADSYFKELILKEFGENSDKTVLDTSLGSKYRLIFAHLRFEHIIIDLTSTQVLMADKIIPKAWLVPYFESQWNLMLGMEQGQDSGPNREEVDTTDFLESSLRCARILPKETEYQWRWIGFNYGIDLVILFQNRMIIFKRNCRNQYRLLANQVHRHIMFRLVVTSVNELGHVTFTKATEIKSHNFAKDEELVVMSLDKKTKFPLRIALNVLYYTPRPHSARKKLLEIASSSATGEQSSVHTNSMVASVSHAGDVETPSSSRDDCEHYPLADISEPDSLPVVEQSMAAAE